MTDYQWKPNELHTLVEGLPVPEGCEWVGTRWCIVGTAQRLPFVLVEAAYVKMLVEELAVCRDGRWSVLIMLDRGGKWIVQYNGWESGPTLLHALVKAWKAAQA